MKIVCVLLCMSWFIQPPSSPEYLEFSISSEPHKTMSHTKPRSCSMDDTKVSYNSLLGMEDRKRRFSEVVDREVRESLMIQKQYRQMQRQIHFHLDKEC